MKYIYFDAASGASGDMILGALLDLGVPHQFFIDAVDKMDLPVEIRIHETKRSSIRSLKVDVDVKREDKLSRYWSDIKELISKTPFKSSVKDRALSIFERLFQAESTVHGHEFHKTHLHEAGADDAIVDILGASLLIEELKIDELFSSPLNVGTGWVKTSHGQLPVPPPAVAELLKEIPVYSSWAEKELVTPTGAAILATLVKEFLPFPEIQYEKIGYGAGGRDLPELPNILRVFYGIQKEFNPEKTVFQIEANIDDASPQILAAFMDKAFKIGALDVCLTPAYMKKNRLGTKLTILTGEALLDSLIRSLFEETTSIGLRYFPVKRRVLQRKFEKIRVLDEEITIKIASMDGTPCNIQPEYEDCLRIAKQKKIPLKKIIELALKEFK